MIYSSNHLLQFFVQVLYLMGLALREEEHQTEKCDEYPVSFTAAVEAYATRHELHEQPDKYLPELLRRIAATPDSASLHDLLLWTVQVIGNVWELYFPCSFQIYEQCSDRRNQPAQRANVRLDSETTNEASSIAKQQNEAEEKEKRRQIAAERRLAAAEQMRRMQQNIMSVGLKLDFFALFQRNEAFFTKDDDDAEQDEELIEQG